MSALPPDQQSLVRSWYTRFGNPPMAGATPKQVAWMQARHYPMPADILRANKLPDSALKQAGEAGDDVAMAIYITRLLDEYHQLYLADRADNTARGILLFAEINARISALFKSGSPYAGYLYSAVAQLTSSRHIDVIAASDLAGLLWACKMGDARAAAMLDTPQIRAVDGGSAASAITLLLRSASYGGVPRALTQPIHPLPDGKASQPDCVPGAK